MTELYPATGWLKRAQEVLDGTAIFLSPTGLHVIKADGSTEQISEPLVLVCASDLPKDLPEPERVIPLPDQTEPEDDDDELDSPLPNAQVEGDDLTGPEAA